MLLLYKVCGHYDKFDLYVTMPRHECVEHGLEHITFMFENIYNTWRPVLGPPLVRDGPLGAHAFVKIAY